MKIAVLKHANQRLLCSPVSSHPPLVDVELAGVHRNNDAHPGHEVDDALNRDLGFLDETEEAGDEDAQIPADDIASEVNFFGFSDRRCPVFF